MLECLEMLGCTGWNKNDIASKFHCFHSDGFYYYYCLGSYHGKGEHYKMSDKEIKLMIAKECLLAMLSNNGEHASCFMDILTNNAWKCATRLLELSQKEEEKK